MEASMEFMKTSMEVDLKGYIMWWAGSSWAYNYSPNDNALRLSC